MQYLRYLAFTDDVSNNTTTVIKTSTNSICRLFDGSKAFKACLSAKEMLLLFK